MSASTMSASTMSASTMNLPYREVSAPIERLTDLARMASTDIETNLVANIADHLHTLFDPVCEDTLPIYFGPLLGRLYLEGL